MDSWKEESGLKIADTPCKHSDRPRLRHLQISGSSPDSDVSSFEALSGHLDVLGKRSLMIYSMQTLKKLWFRLRDITYKQMLMEKWQFFLLFFLLGPIHVSGSVTKLSSSPSRSHGEHLVC